MDSVIIPMKIGVCFLAVSFKNVLSLLSTSCHDAVSFNAGLVGDAALECVYTAVTYEFRCVCELSSKYQS